MHDTYKWAISAISGALAAFFGQYGLFFIIVAVSVVLDVITGLVRALATGEGLDSKKARVGFWRKITLFIALFFGIFLDFSIKNVIIVSGVPFNHTMPFALIVAAYIIINESISICENLYQVNPEAFPPQVVKWMTVAKTNIEKQGMTVENDRELYQSDSVRSGGGQMGAHDNPAVDHRIDPVSGLRGDQCSMDSTRAAVRDCRDNGDNNTNS